MLLMIVVPLSSDLEQFPSTCRGKNTHIGMNAGQEHCTVCGTERRVQVIAMTPNWGIQQLAVTAQLQLIADFGGGEI
jgi:hypothetical protein